MINNNKLFLTAFFATVSLIAQNNGTSAYTTEAVTASTGMQTAKSENIRGGADGRKYHIDDLYDTVIYNDNYYQRSHNNPTLFNNVMKAEPNSLVLDKPATRYFAQIEEQSKKQKALEDARLAEEAKKKNTIPKYFVGGYCIAMQRTELIKSSGFTTLDCDLNFGDEYGYRHAQVFASVYPDYKREIAIAIPIYATFDSGARATFNGIILNNTKTSLNIANEVETYKIRQNVVKYGLAMSDVAYQYANAYLTQLQLSRINQEISYIPTQTSNGGVVTTPVQTTNVEAPKAGEYLALAGIGLLDRLLAIGADNLMADTAPLFTIYKGNRVWIEGVVDFDKNGASNKFGEISKGIKDEVTKNNDTYESSLTQQKKDILDNKNNKNTHKLIMPYSSSVATPTYGGVQ